MNDEASRLLDHALAKLRGEKDEALLTAERMGKCVDALTDTLAILRHERDFFLSMLVRIRCGCFTLDCGKHGAFDPDEVEMTNRYIKVANKGKEKTR
jgi:hypothetical protein